MEMEIRELFITNRFHEKLEAFVRLPVDTGKNIEKNGKLPVIIFISGFGADLHETDSSHDEIAELLAQKGFCTVQFSFAGRGLSEGSYEEMTLNRQADQVDDIISWVVQQSYTDPDRIGVYAMSFGVPSVLRSSLNHVVSMCLTSGAYFPYESLSRRFQETGEFIPDGISWRRASNGEIIKIGTNFWESIRSFDVLKRANEVTIPVCMIHGGMDDKIPVSDAQKTFFALASQQKKLKLFSKGDHGIRVVPHAMRNEFLYFVASWFKETL